MQSKFKIDLMLRLNICRMQKMIIPLMQRTHDSKDAPIDKMNEMENEKRYADTVKSVGESSEQLKRAQAQYDRIAMDLQVIFLQRVRF